MLSGGLRISRPDLQVLSLHGQMGPSRGSEIEEAAGERAAKELLESQMQFELMGVHHAAQPECPTRKRLGIGRFGGCWKQYCG